MLAFFARRQRALCRPCALFLLFGWIAACSFVPATAVSPGLTKNIPFAILEDYDKGDDLQEVARDFNTGGGGL